MRTYTLEVTGRQIISLVLAISRLDDYLRSEGVELNPPAGPVIQALMDNIIDKDPDDLGEMITITVESHIIAAAHATAMTTLMHAEVGEENIRQDLEAWASTTTSMMNIATGEPGPYMN